MQYIRDNVKTTISAIILLLIIFIFWLFIDNNRLRKQLNDTSTQLQSVSSDLAKLEKQNKNYFDALIVAEAKSANYSSVLNQTNEKVGTLEKLTQTDPQLLYKYSKIFFLNENYTPAELTDIDQTYLFNKDRPLSINTNVWPFLKKLLDDADNAGIDLRVISAYRSFGTQATLKSGYKVLYGAGTANSFSADQGYSEHQLGTTIDFTTDSIGSSFNGFEKSDAYNWLLKNAYSYGFVLSYPQGNSYYIFEPWHWRFVGLSLAMRLHTENKSFYDMDQREIDKYLINIWDTNIPNR